MTSAPASQPTSPPPGAHRGVAVREARPLSRLRKMMAKNMAASVQTAALSQVTRHMDLTVAQQARQATSTRLSLNTLILAAVARTLPSHPLLNAELVEERVLCFDEVNLGIAVATPDGLVVPVLKGANLRTLAQLQVAADDLASRARSGKLSMPDIEGGTFTLSNLGMFGIDGGFPIPRPPEGAILLVGRAQTQPAWVDDRVQPRSMAWFSLTFDHRFIDGAASAAFLADLQTALLTSIDS
ncbi:MAG: 2-oxo acid dehydrogenase subunit E2 [Caldilineaceae bacterium]